MTTESDAAPTTPSSQWRANGEPDPHGKHYDCERAALTLGTLTDDELANGAFMNYDRRLSLEDMLNPKPDKHMPIVWMTAVKERIRWLSRALERELLSATQPAAVDRDAALPAAPEGWKLVPVEPTEEMAKAYLNPSMTSWRQRYAAMLAASPAAPSVEQDERGAEWAPARIWLQRGMGDEGSHTWCTESIDDCEQIEYMRVSRESCPTCHGNDLDLPCAFPEGGKPGCPRDIRLARAASTSANVARDADLLNWLDKNMFHREMNEWDARIHRGETMWVMFAPTGVQGTARNVINAALTAAQSASGDTK